MGHNTRILIKELPAQLVLALLSYRDTTYPSKVCMAYGQQVLHYCNRVVCNHGP